MGFRGGGEPTTGGLLEGAGLPCDNEGELLCCY